MLLLNVTTCKREIGLLLISVFRKLFNTQNYGHLDHLERAFNIEEQLLI
jgi:hypothetical protein